MSSRQVAKNERVNISRPLVHYSFAHDPDNRAIMSELRRMTLGHRKRTAIARMGRVAALAVALVVYALANSAGIENLGWMTHTLNIALFALGAMTLGHRRLVRRFSILDEPGACGDLAEARTTASAELRTLIDNALIRLLPQVVSSKADPFDDYQRYLLYQLPRRLHSELFNAHANAHLARCCVRCIRVVGGSEAIPYLESYEGKFRDDVSEAWRSVADEALAALPDVRIRAAKRLISARASSVRQRLAEATERLVGPVEPAATVKG